MTVFNEYARYYDLLYQNKDYSGEAEYIHGLIQTRAAGSKSILNLGCGSGRHDRELVMRGYSVTGIDISEEMLMVARNAAEGHRLLKYQHGDIRYIRLEEKFDVVVSLFHVMSYQTSNDDLLGSFRTAHEHLKPGGLFVFDCWYGPGVLTDLPSVRVKELENDALKITRIAKPKLCPNENIVDIDYHIFIRDKCSGRMDEIRENHRMRYLFVPEIIECGKVNNFKIENYTREFSPLTPDESSWTITVCLRACNDAI